MSKTRDILISKYVKNGEIVGGGIISINFEDGVVTTGNSYLDFLYLKDEEFENVSVIDRKYKLRMDGV